MSYQVLARKWRPRFFREMVGQEHVLQALINALDHNRLHHAYLFTGTRGVGKTSIARVLAKCLNCEQGVSSEPCGQCSSCQEINNNCFVDLIEVDAASRTKVEDTRELLDNVQYAPSKGRYKVYLIDEVHMLSTHSFNALLKTLEEPPEHVKFLLATTDPQKLPATILSRCLQFHLKNMMPEPIVRHLQHILDKEMLSFEEPALWALARAANGSMRDALSLTDQAVAFSSGKITQTQVQTMLGSIDQQTVYKLLQSLIDADVEALLKTVAEFSEQAPDFIGVMDELLQLMHRVTVAQMAPNAIDNSLGDKDKVQALAGQITSEALQLFYQMGLMGKRDLPLAPDLRSGFEMALLRMLAFKPEGVTEPPSKTLPAGAAKNSAGQEVEASSHEKPESKPEPEASLAQEPAAGLEAQEPEAEKKTLSQEPLGEEASRSSVDVQTQAEPKAKPSLVNAPSAEPDLQQALEPVVDVAPEPASAKEPELNTVVHEGGAPTSDLPSQTPAKAKEQQLEVVQNDRPAEPEATLHIHEPTPAVGNSAHWPMDNDAWLQQFEFIEFSGLLRSVANLFVLESADAQKAVFSVDPAQAGLLNPKHGEQVGQALSAYVGRPITAVIEVKSSTLQNPDSYRTMCQQEKQQQALASMKSDPVVQAISQQYSAELVEQSVKVKS